MVYNKITSQFLFGPDTFYTLVKYIKAIPKPEKNNKMRQILPYNKY